MASSNRHWPSLFKSKPCNTHHQWQHDINTSSLLSSPCQKPPYSSAIGSEERTPEPKPRWNPKPEQIRILEAIFNSGMVNPPRDEIRKIRVQLQEYGQVGDANVFYWFQNRKSRSKHKQRQLQSRQQPRHAASASTASTPNVALTAASSSSSSSDPSNSSGCSDKTLQSSKTAASGSNVVDMSNSPTNSVNQTYFQSSQQGDQFTGAEPFFFQTPASQGGYCLSSAADLSLSSFVGLPAADQGLGLRPGIWNELMSQEVCKSTSIGGTGEKGKMQLHNIYGTPATATTTAVITTAASAVFSVASPAAATATTTSATKDTSSVAGPFSDILQGLGSVAAAGSCGASRLVVFINEVAFEVAACPLNVREAFGVDAVLLHSSGLPVLVDEWGVTVQPLQHGASYYVV